MAVDSRGFFERMNYYNENNPEAAEWLRELIRAGEIPPGDVDDRSIEEVKPHEIDRYTQHHFFAGIGGWALALRLAGWPDHRPVRTASCPCQPFSQTGKQLGFADKRHLWPVLFELIKGHGGGIAITFGEQVASPLGREWLARVRTDLESLDHEVGAADLCAAGVGAPHIRQRLYWVAHAAGQQVKPSNTERLHSKPISNSTIGRMANADGGQSGDGGIQRCGQHGQQPSDGEVVGRVEHSSIDGRQQRGTESSGRSVVARCSVDRLGDADGAGSQGRDERIFECDYQWPVGSPNLVVRCEDGKARRFEPGSFPLAHGVSGRVGLLRGYGNAIVPQLAAEFIRAAVEAIENTQ